MKPKVRVVLVGTEGEVNLGFVARLIANFAAEELYLVAPKADPRSDEALRYSAKARNVLENAVMVKDLEEALKDVDLSACTSARVGYRTDVLRNPITPRRFAELAKNYSKVAVVFGRESVGLTREEIAKCDLLVTIPANPDYPVLNLSHAVAIVLYELWLTRAGMRETNQYHPTARGDTINRIVGLIEEIAKLVVDEQRLPHVVAAMKHCIAKASLTAGEASAIYYLFKRVLHSLGRRV